MIVIPTHACSADDGRLPASDVYGELGADNVATCALRVRWGLQRSQDERSPGCGARFAVCHGCGLRTRCNGAPCGACGGAERPEVVYAVCERGADVLAAPVADQGAGVPAAGRTGQGDAGPRRPAEAKAPSKPRAPQKRVKKGATAPDGPGLPLFK